MAGAQSGTRAVIRRRGIAQACAACHQRKVRCDADAGKIPCTNCTLYNTECRVRLRKRKRGSDLSQLENQGNRQDQIGLNSCNTAESSSAQPFDQFERSWTESVSGDSRDERIPSVVASGALVRNGSGQMTTYDASPAKEHNETTSSTPTGHVHDGRAIYFTVIEGYADTATKAYSQPSGLSPVDMATLQESQAFELPSAAIKSCYLENFFKYCYPWVPLVEPAWLNETPTQKPSLLLLQAVLLAGSRVTSPTDLSISQVLYTRAKALFFSNHEKNPVLLVVVCLLLQWWNPAGPERISMDNSNFWHRTGVGIAIQIGLYRNNSSRKDASYLRKLWWFLVARDCQISAAHGRPRAIQLEDSNVPFLSSNDFSTKDQRDLSLSFVSICRIFADVGEAYRRGKMSEATISRFKNDLYYWVRELPRELRLFDVQPELGLQPYNFKSRQIHIIYFVVISILLRKSTPDSSLSTASILASSFISAIFEQFILRDEIRLLGPGIHKFFLLTAGITLLPACKSSQLRKNASEDFTIIKRSLKYFSERYPSGLATLCTLEKLEKTEIGSMDHIVPIDREARSLFREFGPGLCSQWDVLVNSCSSDEDPQRPVGSMLQVSENASHDLSMGAERPRDIQEPRPEDVPFNVDQIPSVEASDAFWLTNLTDMINPNAWILEDSPFNTRDLSGTG